MTKTHENDFVDIYSVGPFCCSVCAPMDMHIDEVCRIVNQKNPTDIDSNWTLAPDEIFSDGRTINGGIVDCHNGRTRHWLLHC